MISLRIQLECMDRTAETDTGANQIGLQAQITLIAYPPAEKVQQYPTIVRSTVLPNAPLW
ncbi:MAG: hypothetical protein FWD57_07445 [Polyangiaceae bacterium]|nr:hypothetical protein [Polyangiaceae bacterium]